MEITHLLEFTSRQQLRDWLTQHHTSARECWVTTYRTKQPRTDSIPYIDVVEEALCFGWIDSTYKRLPDGRAAQRLSPRRKGSHWTELNKQRCQDLIARGLMTPAGMQAYKRIKVVAAIIISQEHAVFATQRGYGEWKDWWEFPGGKMEAGETPEEALKREIQEELSASIRVDKHLCTVEYDYPAFHLTLHCYCCSLQSDSMHLNEHEAARWLTTAQLDSVRWLPADLEVIAKLKKHLSEFS